MAEHRFLDDADPAPEVRRVQPYQATKTYRCPGCDHPIPPGTGHIVVVPERAGGPAPLAPRLLGPRGADEAPLSYRSLPPSSSTLTSLNVTTRTVFTKRAGRYMSHTQASVSSSSK